MMRLEKKFAPVSGGEEEDLEEDPIDGCPSHGDLTTAAFDKAMQNSGRLHLKKKKKKTNISFKFISHHPPQEKLSN